jgi:hypothetical protein
MFTLRTRRIVFVLTKSFGRRKLCPVQKLEIFLKNNFPVEFQKKYPVALMDGAVILSKKVLEIKFIG